LAGRDQRKLTQLQTQLGDKSSSVVADLNEATGIATLALAAQDFKTNVLINNAGLSAFGLFEEQDWADIAQVLAANLTAPMQLTHALLPQLKSQPSAAILNVGSTFGSIPFAGFAAYSASKAGLKGFSQSLRRELADTSVAVIHVAPRAIATTMNSAAVNTLNTALQNNSDSPETVAQQILAALQHGRGEHHFGFPERLFAWLNGFAPALIDNGLSGKLAVIKQHAQGQNKL
jgi:short-subunit dehydrogenase